MSRRRRTVVLGLVAALVAVLAGRGAGAQVLPPLPPLPPPPADGSPLSDVLGPSATGYCDTVATVQALAGPIVSAQLPEEAQVLVEEVTPYLSVVTYACGLVAAPPTEVRCATDDALADQLGVLGLPVNSPAPGQVLVDTAAGIEHVFRRAGIDLDAGLARQLAAALGCGALEEVVPPTAAPAPSEEGPLVAPPAPARPTSSGFVPPRPVVPAVSPRPGLPAAGAPASPAVDAAAVRYPVDPGAAALLALPLAALVAAAVVAPRLGRRRRDHLRSSGAA